MSVEEEFIVALHEAGHAVLSAIFNRGPVHLSIYPDPENPLVLIGRTDSLTGLEEDEINPQNIKECVMVALAGSMAERLYCDSSGGFDEDVEDALANLRLLSPSADCRDLGNHLWECQEILADPLTWGKVLSIASALLDRRELSGAEAREIIRACERSEPPPIQPVQLRIGVKDALGRPES